MRVFKSLFYGLIVDYYLKKCDKYAQDKTKLSHYLNKAEKYYEKAYGERIV